MTLCGRFRQRGRPAREGAPLVPTSTNFPFTEQVKTAYLGLVCYRLTASQGFIKGFDLYAYPARTSFCSCKRKQNTLGEYPETPDAWLRWIRMLFFCYRRKINPYGAQMRSKGSLRRLVGRNLCLIGQTLRYAAGSPLRCGAPSSPHKVLRPCGDPPKARALEREGRTTTPLLPLSLQCRTASLTRSHCSCRSPRNCRCFRHRRRSNSLPLKGGELWCG